jgi:hypothetical protein
MMPLVPPIRLELQTWGEEWGDIAFGTGDQLLVSAELKQLVIRSGMTGFERFDAVEMVKIKKPRHLNSLPPVYELASIQRSRAAVDDEASKIIRQNSATCSECRIDGLLKRADRIVIEPGTWSGEDILFARGLPGIVLVSERFKSLCDENNPANCTLVEADAFSFDHYPWEQK